MYAKVCNDSFNITIVMGSEPLYLSMGHTFDARNSEIWVYMPFAYFGIGILHVKRHIRHVLTYFLWRHFSALSSLYCFI